MKHSTRKKWANRSLTKAVVLSLLVGTGSLVFGGAADAAQKTYTSATITDNTAIGYYSVYPYSESTSVTALGDNTLTKVTGTLTISGSNYADLKLTNGDIHAITVTGSKNNITLGSSIGAITFSNGGVDTNNVTIAGTYNYDITDAKNVTVNSGATVSNISSTKETVTVDGTAGYIDTSGNDVTLTGGTTDYITNTGTTTTNADVTVEKKSTVSTTTANTAGISNTMGNVEVDKSTVTSDKGSGISVTSGSVTVSGGSTVTGSSGAGIRYTGYTNATTKSDKGGNVTISDGSSVTGSNNGVYDTNGSVSATGTSSTSLSSITGTAGAGVANTTGDIALTYAKVTGGTQGITTTGGNVTAAHSTLTGTNNAGIYNTTGNIELNDTTVTGGTHGINATGGSVEIKGGSTIKGNGGDGITNTGYNADGTETTDGGSVTITDSSVEGNNGINYTNGDVSVTGKSTKAATVKGTSNVGIANTTGSIDLKYSEVTGNVQGINTTGGDITVTDSKVTGTTMAGIYNTTGDITVTKSTITGKTYGINATNGKTGITLSNAIIKADYGTDTDTSLDGSYGTGIANTAGDVIQSSNNSTVSGSKYGIYKTDGTVSLMGTDKHNSTVTGKTGGIYKTGKNLVLKNETITTGTDSTAGDAINDVAGTVTLDTDTVYSNAGSGIVTDEGTRTAVNTNTVSIKDTQVTGNGGDGINTKYRTDVELNGVTVTAKNNGIIVGDPTGTTAGALHITTTTADHTITAGNSGIVAYDDAVTLDGNTKLTINLTNDGTNQDVHDDAGFKILAGSTLTNPTVATDIIISADDSASGLIVKGSGSKITLTNQANPVTITSNATAVNVDGIYAVDSGNVEINNAASLSLKGTGEVNGIHAAAGTGTTADPTKVTLTDVNLDDITSNGVGNARGIYADGNDTDGGAVVVKTSYTSTDPNKTNQIIVSNTGIGEADGIYTTAGGQTTTTGLKGIDVTAANSPSSQYGALGIYAAGTNADVTSDNAVIMDAATGGAISATSKSNGMAIGILAGKYGTNTAENVTGITATANYMAAIGLTAVGTSASNIVNDLGTPSAGALSAMSTKSLAYGINASYGGSNTVGNIDDKLAGITSITAQGAVRTYGIIASGKDANGKESNNTIQMAGELTATDANTSMGTGVAYGIYANNTGDNVVEGVTNITATEQGKGNAYAISAQISGSTNNVNEAITEVTAENAKGSITATTKAGTAYAINAMNNGTNIVGGVTSIDAEGTTGAYGINADTGTAGTVSNTVYMDDAITATTTNGNAAGISATNAGSNVVKGTTSIDAENTTDGDVFGIHAEAANSTNDVTMSGTLTANSAGTGDTGGIVAITGAANTVTGVTDITSTTKEGYASGIYAVNSSQNTVNADATSKLGILTVASTRNADGIIAAEASTNNIAGLGAITVDGSVNVNGINAVKDSTNNVNAGVTTDMGSLTVTSDNGAAYGINADATDGTGTTANHVGGLTTIDVTSTSNTAKAISATGSSDTATALNEVNLTSNITVAAKTSGDAYGIMADKYGTNTVTGTNATALSVTSDEGIAAGIDATNNGTNTVTGLTDISIKTASSTASGINAQYNSTNTVNGTGAMALSVTTNSGIASGINAMDNSTNTVTGLADITVNGTEKTAGISAVTNSTDTVTMNGTLTVNGGNDSTEAIIAQEKSTITVTGIQSISASSTGTGEVEGVGAKDNSTVTLAQADGTSGVDVTASSTGSGPVYAVWATNNSTISNVKDVTATSKSASAYGVSLGSGTNTITSVNNITVSGDYEAAGVSCYGDGTNTLNVAGNITTTSTGDGYAEGVYNEGNQSLTVTVAGNVTTSAPNTGGTADAIYSSAGNATTDVTVKGNISVSGDEAALVYAYNGDTATLTAGGTTTLQGTTKAMAVEVGDQSTVNLNNINVKVEGPTDATYAVNGTGDGGTVNLVNTNITGTGTNGSADVYYDNSDTDAGNDLNVNIDGTSSLTGAANAVTDSADKGAININNAGTWNVTGDSNLNSAGTSSITNSGVMDMTKDGHAFSTVKTNTLDHSGTLLMDVKVKNGDAQQADQIQTTTASGSGIIYVHQTDSDGVHYQDQVGQPLIITTNNNASYKVMNDGNNLLETGSWKYNLVAKTITQEDVDKYGIDPSNIGKTGWVLANTADLSHKAKAALSSIVTPDIWYLETDALYDQIGNYTSARSDWDVWGHYVHSKMSQDNAVSQNNYIGQTNIDTKFNGAVIGADKKIRSGQHSDTWLGVMVGYGKGTTDFENGSADVKSTTAGIYGVYKNDKNEYLSGILKYNHYSTSSNTTTSGGIYSDGDFSQNGYGVSVLAGKRIEKANGWFIEPQLEFGHHRINSANWDLGDMDIDTGDMNSTRARVGVGVGQMKPTASGYWDWYVRASLVHEFQGDTTAYLYGEPFKVDYGGTWGQYKLGFDYTTQHGPDYNLAFVYNHGGDKSSPVGVQASINVPF